MVPFLNWRYRNRVPFLSKIVYKRVKGLDLGAEHPRIKLCWVSPRGSTKENKQKEVDT